MSHLLPSEHLRLDSVRMCACAACIHAGPESCSGCGVGLTRLDETTYSTRHSRMPLGWLPAAVPSVTAHTGTVRPVGPCTCQDHGEKSIVHARIHETQISTRIIDWIGTGEFIRTGHIIRTYHLVQ